MKFIPRASITICKSSHPWLDDLCKEAVLRKNRAENTDRFEAECNHCTQVLNSARAAWIQRTKEKLNSPPRSNKQWWRINRQLMRRRAQATSIPVLKEDDRWLTDAKDKADAFARVFVSKSKLPDEFVDAPFFGATPNDGIRFLPLRTRNAVKLFRK